MIGCPVKASIITIIIIVLEKNFAVAWMRVRFGGGDSTKHGKILGSCWHQAARHCALHNLA